MWCGCDSEGSEGGGGALRTLIINVFPNPAMPHASELLFETHNQFGGGMGAAPYPLVGGAYSSSRHTAPRQFTHCP